MATSAVDVISPAYVRTKRQLFKPFRAGRWARLAVVALVSGEFGSGSWGGLSNARFPVYTRGRIGTGRLFLLADWAWQVNEYLWIWILAGIVAVTAFGLAWIYAASVYRFILLDSVIHDRCDLREGWRRWRGHGRHYFLWNLGFALAVIVALGLLIGGPVFVAQRAGILRQPGQHLALLISAGLALFFVALVLIVASAVTGLFAKDFLVPVMALENVGVLEAWRRFLPMVNVEKGAYTVYVVMKIVLAVGSAILFGIANVIALLVLLIPLGIVGVAIFATVHVLALTWNAWTIGLFSLLCLAVVAGLLWIISFIYAPGLVFFQSYSLYFLAARYPALNALMSPTPPAPPLASDQE